MFLIGKVSIMRAPLLRSAPLAWRRAHVWQEGGHSSGVPIGVHLWVGVRGGGTSALFGWRERGQLWTSVEEGTSRLAWRPGYLWADVEEGTSGLA